MPKFSILIIEDEKNIQTFMRKILILSFLISDFPI